jgi:hypothetical protein
MLFNQDAVIDEPARDGVRTNSSSRDSSTGVVARPRASIAVSG